jgi:signal transduction histidine kinase
VTIVYSLLIISIFNLLFGLLVLIKSPRNKIFTVFVILVFSAALWSFGLGMFIVSNNSKDALIWTNVYYIAGALIGYFLMIFASIFPEEKDIKPMLLILYTIPVIIYIALILFIPEFLVKGVIINENGNDVNLGKSEYFLYIVLLVTYIYMALLVLYTKYRKYNGLKRYQLLFIFSSILIAAIAGTIFDLILPWFGNYELIWVGPQFTIIMIVIMFYAIARYHLFDIKIVIGRISYYSILAAIFFVSFYISLAFDEIFFGSSFTLPAYISGVFIALGYVYLFNNVNKFIKEKIDSVLINPGFTPGEELNKFNAKITTKLDYQEIAAVALNTISKTVRPFNEAIILFGEDAAHTKIYSKTSINFNNFSELMKIKQVWETIGQVPINYDRLVEHIDYRFRNMGNWIQEILEEMRRSEIRLLVPIRTLDAKGYVGMMVLGAKEGESAFNSIEMEYLQNIANSVGAALARAYYYDQIVDLNSSLQKRVAKATAELREKIEALEESRRRERDMLDILGHELRTPLTIVRNAISTMQIMKNQDILTPEKLDSYIAMADENVKREVSLLETMLATTKIDNDSLNLTLAKVDIKDVVHDSLEALSSFAERKGLEIRAQEIPQVYSYSDRTRTQQIVDNILSNAIKYTEKGYVEIKVLQEGGFIKILFKDSGVGIPEDKLKLLGKKFYRVNTYLESSKKAGTEIVRPGGTGLGLYVVFNLAKSMGGAIDVKSEVGKGSEFLVTLPAYDGQKTAESNPQKSETVYERFKKMREVKENGKNQL